MKENKNNEVVKYLLENYDIKNANDIAYALKDMFKDTIQTMMNAEFDSSMGYEKSDKIYYLKRSPITVYRQMIIRWIRQKVGKEDYNVKSTINHFFKNLSDVKAYFNIESSIINSLKEYQEKVIFLDKKQQVKLLKD